MTKHLRRTLTMWVGLSWDTSPCRQMVWRAGLETQRTLWLIWAGSSNWGGSTPDWISRLVITGFQCGHSGEAGKTKASCWLSYLRSQGQQQHHIPGTNIRFKTTIKYLQGDSVLAMHWPSIYVCILALSIFLAQGNTWCKAEIRWWLAPWCGRRQGRGWLSYRKSPWSWMHVVTFRALAFICIAPSESVESVKGGGRDREKNGGDEHFGK